MNFSCQWNCPSYFGGKACSNNCAYNISFTDLKTLIAPISLSYYSDMSHTFTLTLTSSDGIRSTSADY